MAYHHSCYEQKFGKTAKKAVSKKPGFICAICHKEIMQGEFFTWTRRGNPLGKVDGPPGPDAPPSAPEEPGQEQQPSKGKENSGQGAKANAPDVNLVTDKGLLPARDYAEAIGQGILNDVDTKIAEVEERIMAKLEPALKQAAEQATQGFSTVIKVTEIQLKDPVTGDVTSAGVQHRDFGKLLRFIKSGCNVWLCGPAGSGKTRACLEVAKLLGKPFFFTGAVGDQYGLSGFMNGAGEYVPSNFFKAFTQGGIFLWDEVDASSADALLWANAAIENGYAAFPHGIFERHPDCIIIAAANTWGNGATHEYVGRSKQDVAFLTRFVHLAWSYDEDLEAHLAVHKEWARRVQQVRANVAKKGIRVLITPRATFYGDKLLQAGCTQEEVEAAVLKCGMTEEQWAQVRGNPAAIPLDVD